MDFRPCGYVRLKLSRQIRRRKTSTRSGEIALRKYLSVLGFCQLSGASNCETVGSNSFHSSPNTAWEFIEAVDTVIQKKNTAVIRTGGTISLVLDTTTDERVCLALYLRVCLPDKSIRMFFGTFKNSKRYG